jgi:hypothetical protein
MKYKPSNASSKPVLGISSEYELSISRGAPIGMRSSVCHSRKFNFGNFAFISYRFVICSGLYYVAISISDYILSMLA